MMMQIGIRLFNQIEDGADFFFQSFIAKIFIISIHRWFKN